MSILIKAECPCGNGDEYPVDPSTADIEMTLLHYGWISYEGVWYCDVDCLPTDYDPRTEALTIGERNPGLAGRYE